MTPELKKQIKEVRAVAKEQSDKWWDIICDEDSFEPYTDDDQIKVDSIVSQYDSIIDQLLQGK
ncbi:hypothetical protein [Lactiplantibacillus plantarum]|uniref:hypothetical protein n=1 Tax=Lactiplantibacillus plantarum TaxID=1590 RepID=UPI000F8F3910|nr:hypothetical protein [Lactiplantibacillus plantarum]RUS44118.1 hypothetical protein EL800_03155 [Lactiplantibacillus plantarum]RXK93349.1 hypothetical protein ETC33_02715 [Lactiplantibacillus plantarum]